MDTLPVRKTTNTAQVPHIIGCQPVFDSTVWIRLPRPGARCPISGLSRSSLAELARPCERNQFQPPVIARVLKRKGAQRGVLLVSRESLLGYINDLPVPSTTTQESGDESSATIGK